MKPDRLKYLIGIGLLTFGTVGALIPFFRAFSDPATKPVLLHPTVFAVIATVATFVVVFVLTLRGRAKLRWIILGVFLASMPTVYVLSWVFGDRANTQWLAIELAGQVAFLAFTVFGATRKRKLLWIGAGIIAHGLLWDVWHGHSTYIPTWYVMACTIIDVCWGAFALLMAGAVSPSPKQ